MNSLAFTMLYAHRLVTEALIWKIFRSLPWKNVLKIFKNIGHSLKHFSSS